MILEHWNKCLWLEGQLFYMEWFCLLWNALSQTLVLILLSQVFVGYVWDVSTFLVTASRTFHATFAKWTHWKSCVSTITHCCHHRPLWVSHVELLVSHGRWELCVGMLTRLARLETRKNFSVSRILFLTVENFRQLDRTLSLWSFNDHR